MTDFNLRDDEIVSLARRILGRDGGRPTPLDPELEDHGQVFDEDGYCKACGNGFWKFHMPDCEIADLAQAVVEFHERLTSTDPGAIP